MVLRASRKRCTNGRETKGTVGHAKGGKKSHRRSWVNIPLESKKRDKRIVQIGNTGVQMKKKGNSGRKLFTFSQQSQKGDRAQTRKINCY